MALVETPISQYNDGRSIVWLTYDNVTLEVDHVRWANLEGHWTWTISRPGRPDITAVIPPGGSGQQAVPAGYFWAVAKGQQPNFSYQDSWTRE